MVEVHLNDKDGAPITATNPLPTADHPTARTALTTHRSAIAAADKITSPTLVTLADQTGQAGSLTAVSHGAAVAAGNAFGSAGTSNILTATPTVNKTLDLTVPQATGATYYDVFCSTATTAPLWVGRITEAQRVAGCSITAVGTVGAAGPGGAGKVNIQVVGTGVANTNAIFAGNNAYVIAGITGIACTAYKKLIVKVSAAITDLRSAPSLTVVPFFSDDDITYYAGTAQAVSIMTGAGYPLNQQFELDVDGEAYVRLLIGTISGQGTAVTVKTQLV